MKEGYSDILSRIEADPKWYDQNGTPRYDDFHPRYCPDIYSSQVVLLRIGCQVCGREFDVEMHAGIFSRIEHPHKLHYGDPPIHDCVGDTMNCEDLEVLEVWKKQDTFDWTRLHALEGTIT